jgi:hypothetical protein
MNRYQNLKPNPPRSERWQKLPVLIQLYIAARVFFAVDLPRLGPRRILIPSAFAQITVFVYAALSPVDKFLPLFAVGNLIIIALAIFPMLVQPPKPTAHWVTSPSPLGRGARGEGGGYETH